MDDRNWPNILRSFPRLAVTPRMARKELERAKKVESNIEAKLPMTLTNDSMLWKAGREFSSAI